MTSVGWKGDFCRIALAISTNTSAGKPERTDPEDNNLCRMKAVSGLVQHIRPRGEEFVEVAPFKIHAVPDFQFGTLRNAGRRLAKGARRRFRPGGQRLYVELLSLLSRLQGCSSQGPANAPGFLVAAALVRIPDVDVVDVAACGVQVEYVPSISQSLAHKLGEMVGIVCRVLRPAYAVRVKTVTYQQRSRSLKAEYVHRRLPAARCPGFRARDWCG